MPESCFWNNQSQISGKVCKKCFAERGSSESHPDPRCCPCLPSRLHNQLRSRKCSPARPQGERMTHTRATSRCLKPPHDCFDCLSSNWCFLFFYLLNVFQSDGLSPFLRFAKVNVDREPTSACFRRPWVRVGVTLDLCLECPVDTKNKIQTSGGIGRHRPPRSSAPVCP